MPNCIYYVFKLKMCIYDIYIIYDIDKVIDMALITFKRALPLSLRPSLYTAALAFGFGLAVCFLATLASSL